MSESKHLKRRALAANVILLMTVSIGARALGTPAVVLEDKQYNDEYAVARDIASPDGRWTARRESAALGDHVRGDRIVLVDAHTGVSRVIFDTVASEEQSLMDSIDNLAFSPSSNEILFILSGGTAYYPRDVMTIELDGTHLKQLTSATPMKSLKVGEGYTVDSATYSPDGKRILLTIEESTRHGNDAAEIAPSIAVIRADEEKQSAAAIAVGRSSFWSTDGTSFYYEAADGTLMRADLAGKATVAAPAGHKPFLGSVPKQDAVFIDTGVGQVAIQSLGGIPVDQAAAASAAGIALRDSAGRRLRSITLIADDQLSLVYGPSPVDLRVHVQNIRFP